MIDHPLLHPVVDVLSASGRDDSNNETDSHSAREGDRA
jgi:hypothetical protein